MSPTSTGSPLETEMATVLPGFSTSTLPSTYVTFPTGAAKAIGEVVPEVAGKLDGIALRVPVADGSITDLVVELKKSASIEKINQAFKKSAEKDLKGILEYTEEPLVSADIVGNPHSCIFDSLSTMVIDNRLVKVLGWYDNEWAYANRLVEMAELVGEKI